MKKILFVCNGNIYRSPIAAECLKTLLKKEGISNIEIDSYGIQGTGGVPPAQHTRLSEYPIEWNAAKPTLDEYGIDISQHTSQGITPHAMEEASVVIAMDKKILSEAPNSLLAQFPQHTEKFHLFAELNPTYGDIEDPSGKGDPSLHHALITHIRNTLENSYQRVLGWAH